MRTPEQLVRWNGKREHPFQRDCDVGSQARLSQRAGFWMPIREAVRQDQPRHIRYIVFDSDGRSNRQVQAAEQALAGQLRKLGGAQLGAEVLTCVTRFLYLRQAGDRRLLGPVSARRPAAST